MIGLKKMNKRKNPKSKSPWAVFLAILLGMVLGGWMGKDSSLLPLLDIAGRLFLNALTMVVVPLVAASIITSVARMGADRDFGRLGAKTVICYILTNLSAIFVGILFVDLIQPGTGIAKDLLHSSCMQNAAGVIPTEIPLMNLVMQIIPANIFAALSSGQMLSIIVFSLLFGYALSKLPHNHSSTMQNFFQGLFEAMIRLTQLVMKILPLGVFCLVAKVFATTGWHSLTCLGWFVVTVLAALLTFSGVVLPIFVRLLARVSPWKLVKAMNPALVTAFSTSSSSASLPITMECVEHRVGVSSRVTSLVVPLGTSLNMSGSALYECVAALFVAQLYGIEISFLTQVLVLILSLVTSMGVAGVPAASLVAVIVILRAMGLPEEAVGLFIAVERLLDMARTLSLIHI